MGELVTGLWGGMISGGRMASPPEEVFWPGRVVCLLKLVLRLIRGPEHLGLLVGDYVVGLSPYQRQSSSIQES